MAFTFISRRSVSKKEQKKQQMNYYYDSWTIHGPIYIAKYYCNINF